MDPAARYKYLEWLASGACAPIDIGYVFVFFYGLERRLLVDGGLTHPQAPRLLEEIERLVALYDGDQTFKRYAAALLDFCRNSQRTNTESLSPEECTSANSYEVPFALRLKLGVAARDGLPLPSDWAHCWSLADPLIVRRTPVSRCPEEFKRAFAHAYTEAFEAGMVLPRNKTLLKTGYQPASASLRGAKIEISCDVPDILATTASRKRLQEVVDRATELIDSYSRCLSRNEHRRGQIETVVSLPITLWPKELLQVVHDLREDAQTFSALTCGELLIRLGYEQPPNPGLIAAVWKALEDKGIGIEPDVNNGARRPKPDDAVILFQLSNDSPNKRTSARYSEMSLEVALAACLALADGHACDRELAQTEQAIEAAEDLALDLKTRLRAFYRLQVRKPLSLAALKVKLQTIPEPMRLAVARRLSSLASSDGTVSPEEVRFLETLYKSLQLNPQLVYNHLYSEKTKHFTNQSTAAIPPDPAVMQSGVLDLNRIRRLQAETEQVSALLANVFVDAETEPVVPEGQGLPVSMERAAPEAPSLLPGLDSLHNQFLLLLLTRAQWSRIELNDAASDMQLMLDGALERINEAALDSIGAALLEGDDPVFVEQTLLETAAA